MPAYKQIFYALSLICCLLFIALYSIASQGSEIENECKEENSTITIIHADDGDVRMIFIDTNGYLDCLKEKRNENNDIADL